MHKLESDCDYRDWFREATFGMFIHWGLYAIPAGTWKGIDNPSISEWTMHKFKIPVSEYENLARKFNPMEFDAGRWVKIARDAGMKYIVFTAKHHDGFAMFHSKFDKFNVVDATPFKRDPLQELADACREAGIRLGIYYSHDQDWHERGGSGNFWDFKKRTDVNKLEGNIAWPEEWKVFGPLDRSDPILEEKYLKDIPDEICVGDKRLRGNSEIFNKGSFDFGKYFKNAASRINKVAYAFTRISVPHDTTISVGAGADWWMEWFLNGKHVMDTLAKGNEYSSFSISNHVFNLKLKKGENVLAVRFISGSGSSVLVTGGPGELKKNGWSPVPGLDPDTLFSEYLEKKVKMQLKELLTNYGPVSILWFDTPRTIKAEQSRNLADFVHSIQPDCLVSGRVGHNMGDYESLGDNKLPDGVLSGIWEGVGTTNTSWGFKANDREWKSSRHLLETLVNLVSKNANYLLNVGPDANGAVPLPAVRNLRIIGRWLKINGEAVYGASPVDINPDFFPWGKLTRKNKRLFIIVLKRPESGSLLLYGLRNKVKDIHLLGDKKTALSFNETHRRTLDCHKLEIKLLCKKRDVLPVVIAIDADGEINLNASAYHN